jgi:hypothetical protein
LTKCGRVINANCRVLFSAIEFDPRERCLLDTKAPNITDRFLTGITSKDKEMRL